MTYESATDIGVHFLGKYTKFGLEQELQRPVLVCWLGAYVALDHLKCLFVPCDDREGHMQLERAEVKLPFRHERCAIVLLLLATLRGFVFVLFGLLA